MNTEHTNYLKWLDFVESYYRDSLLRVLQNLPRQYREYEEHSKESEEVELLLNTL